MQADDYPSLHRASDGASRNAQKRCFQLLGVQLGLFFFVGLLGFISQSVSQAEVRAFLTAIAISLATAVVVMLVGRERRYDKLWFDGRAIAESVKTATWRYMMGAAPFLPSLPNADERFVAELEEIRRARPEVVVHLAGRAAGGDTISRFMTNMRTSDFATRKAEYLESRVRDQNVWYDSKARWNRRRSAFWYWAVLLLQLSALALAVIAAVYGPFKGNLVGLIMTAGASLTAWSQAKRYDDLSNSYSLAA
jgi:hypothetical protein